MTQVPDVETREKAIHALVMPNVVKVEKIDCGVTSCQVTSFGAGFFVRLSKDLIVVTAAHVLGDGTEFRVTTQDGTEYSTTVAMVDPTSDLAVLRVSGDHPQVKGLELATTLPTARTKVLAFGHPFGQLWSCTGGSISAIRTQPLQGQSEPITVGQTETALNPGNSGGPICDMEGRVVGVADYIITEVGGSHGVNFFVAVDSIDRILAAINKSSQAAQLVSGMIFVDTPSSQLVLWRGGSAWRGIRPVQKRKQASFWERIGQRLSSRPKREAHQQQVVPHRVKFDDERAAVVTHVNGTPVSSVEEFLIAVMGSKRRLVNVSFARGTTPSATRRSFQRVLSLSDAYFTEKRQR